MQPKSDNPGPSFAVAFGGGGARGLAHIHVIRALDELGIRPVAIAGSSIGAMMGAAMAAGIDGRAIEDHARAVLSDRREAMARLWRSRPRGIGAIVAGGVRLGQFDVGRILRAFLPEGVPERFEALTIPLQVTATDFYRNSGVVLGQGELYPALAASAALPPVFRPVSHEGRLLIDGGIANPVPFDLLHGVADIVIAVDVVGAPCETGRGRPSSIELMMGASQIMMGAITGLKRREGRPHILLQPPVDRFGVLDFLKVDQVLDETATVRDELKRQVDAIVAARSRNVTQL